MPPGDHLAVLVEPGLDALHRDGVQEAVANIVFPRPLHLHRRAEFLREQRRFEREIAFRFAAEPAAEQRDVDGDVLLGDAERLGDVLARAAGALHRRPDLGLVALDVGDRDRRLHADMGEMRQIIFADDHLVGALQRGVDVALLAHDEARFARGLLELAPDRRPNSYLALAPSSQVSFSASRPLIAAPVLRAITATPPSGWNFDGHGQPLTSITFSTPETFIAADAVERHQLAAGHRRTGDDGIFHAGQPDVGAVARLAGGDVAEVDNADLALAEIPEILRVLQLQAFDARHRLLGGVGGEIAEAELASARAVDDLVIDGLHLGRRHAPAFRRGLLPASCAPRRRSGASGSDNAACCASRRYPGCRI